MKNMKILWLAAVLIVAAAMMFGCAGQQQTMTEETPEQEQIVEEEAPLVDEEQVALEQARADSIAQVQAEEQRRLEEARLEAERLEAERLEAERLETERRLAEERDAKASLRTIYYAFDSSSLTSKAREDLRFNAELLRQYKNWSLIIEGHCDERGTTEYNLALGERRATTVKQYYLDYGIAASQLKVISYGEERPQVSGTGKAVWSKNRRAVTVAK